MPRKRMLLRFQYFSKVIYLKMLLLGHQKIAIHRALEILTEASIYNMDHIIWTISYGPYDMVHILCIIRTHQSSLPYRVTNAPKYYKNEIPFYFVRIWINPFKKKGNNKDKIDKKTANKDCNPSNVRL